MKGILIFVLLGVSVVAGFAQNSWKKEGIKLPHPICYASDEVHHSFIEPSHEYYQLLKSATTKKSTIEVTYTGFSVEAKRAFEYAVSIWENLIYSPVPIRIKADWVSLSQGVLASCGPADYFKNFNSTQKWNVYYPIVLVEKMLGEEVNSPNQFDVIGSFNKDFTNWYFGIDGKTPVNQYDFVTTVMHELAHGLGFSGFFYSESRGRGGYGTDGLSAIFDQFVIDKDHNNLVNKSIYANPSNKLSLSLSSGWLEFNTNLVKNQIPRLYAPSTWDDGSSIYHLDELTYPASDTNSMMTPFAGKGEAVHDPGPNTLAIMYDMGWKTISIRHKQLKDIEFVSAPIDFSAEIVSDFDLDSSKVFLVYSGNKFVKADSVLMKSSDVPANFSASLSMGNVTELNYFFSATDAMNRRLVFPADAPSRYLSFKIGTDKEAPVVTHEPVKYMVTTNLSAKIDAEVTDNIGLKSVKIEYFINGGGVKEIALLKDTTDVYSGNLVFPSGIVKDGDKISYRIVAVDSSSQANIGKSPLSGYHIFYIQGIQNPVEKYLNDFNTQTNDFISSDFTISTATGFDNQALNSAHPYSSPDTDEMNFNFVSILKYPIILKAGGKMSFDEIVLVEPGETGAKFGVDEFWDYVIVEGSKDGGNNWKPLIDGYDSNAQSSWLTLYNSATVGQNSTAVPDKNLFVKREFELLAKGNFQVGDTIQVRFRLYSDPYAHGWGWIIDKLVIQDFGTDVNSLEISSGEVVFYPNPASDLLNFQLQTKSEIDKLVLKGFNSSGKIVYNQQFGVGSSSFKTSIDVSNFIPGLYLFSIVADEGKGITRKILVR